MPKDIGIQLSKRHKDRLKEYIEYYIKKVRPGGNFRAIASELFLFNGNSEGSKNILGNSETTRRNLHKSQFENCCLLLERDTDLRTKKIGDPKGYIKWKREVLAAYKEVEKNPKVRATPIKKTNQTKQSRVPAHKFVKEVIENSKWYTYELEDFRISKRVLIFTGENENGYTDFTLTEPSTINGAKGILWVGDVRFIEADNLLVGISKLYSTDGEENHYTHFTIQINRRSLDLQMCVGHKTYFNYNTHNVISKTIVLERIYEDNLVPAFHDLDDNACDEAIRSFFSDPKQNRLSSPHAAPAIYNPKTFTKWIEKNNYDSKLDDSIKGEYQVFYKLKPEAKSFQTDRLIISKNIKGQWCGRYEEWIKGKLSHYWEGTFDENLEAHTFSIFMNQSYKESKKTHLKLPLFLLIMIPESGGVDIDTLTGAVAGVRSGNKGAVSRLVVITKINGDEFCVDFDQNILEKFFDKFALQSRVRPPHKEFVCNFEDLRKIAESD